MVNAYEERISHVVASPKGLLPAVLSLSLGE